MYNDYTLYQAPSDPSKSPRNGNEWSQPPFAYGPSNKNKPTMFQPHANVSREFSKELQQRVQSHKNTMNNKSVDAIKRKFDGLAKVPVPPPPIFPSFNSAGNMYRPPPVRESNSNTNCVINTTLEESYWAQWKPQQSSSTSWSDNKPLKDPASILKRSIAAFNRAARCGSPPPTTNETPPLIKPKDEKSLKVIRKPMEILESNSSEGDKSIPMKLFGYNRMSTDAPQPPCRSFVKTTPTIVMNVPTYPVNYCTRINEQPQRDERFVMSMNETRNCRMNSIDDIKDENEDAMCNQRCNVYASNKRSQSCDETKRPKPDKRRIDKYKKNQQTKSDEEVSDCFRDACSRNRVRFCTRKRCDENESNDSDITPKDSSRTIDGYHGDIDTESYNPPKDCRYEFDNDSFEEGQGDLESDPFENPRGSCGQSLSGNSLRPMDTESFEDQRTYEQYKFFNNNRYYTQTYQCVIPDNNRSRQEDSGSDTISSKIDHEDNRSYNLYMDHSQVYGDQANYVRGVYDADASSDVVRHGNGYKQSAGYPKSDSSRCECKSPHKCTCHNSNSVHSGKHKSYVGSSKGTPKNEVSGRKGSGRMKMRSPREMDDISEKSYCTSKSMTIKDKSLCCVCNEEETPPETGEPCNDLPKIGEQNAHDMEPYFESSMDTHVRQSDKGAEESHTKKTEERRGGESCSSTSKDEMSNDCCQNNLRDEHLQRKQSSSSTDSCRGYSSNDDIAVAESIKNIAEEAVPQKHCSDVVPNNKGSDDSLSIVAETVYAVHNLQTDFEVGRYDASPTGGDSMKVLHRTNVPLRARSSLSTDRSKTSQPPMMLQLSRSSRTATSNRSSYNKGHTYTLKSPHRKSATRSPKQKR